MLKIELITSADLDSVVPNGSAILSDREIEEIAAEEYEFGSQVTVEERNEFFGQCVDDRDIVTSRINTIVITIAKRYHAENYDGPYLIEVQ